MSIMEGFNFFQNYYNYPIDYNYMLPYHSLYQPWQSFGINALNQSQNIHNVFHHIAPIVHENSAYYTPRVKVQESLLQEKTQENQKQAISPNLKVRKSRSHPEGQSFNISEPKQPKNGAEQKQNRNVYSNILRNFFRRVNDFAKIEPLVRKILKFHQLNVTAEDFIEFVKKLKVNHSKYLRFKNLRPLFIDDQWADYSLIFRVLMEIFRKSDLILQTLTSRKIGKWSINLHLKGSRQIKDKLYR